jgi:hypothetical protein
MDQRICCTLAVAASIFAGFAALAGNFPLARWARCRCRRRFSDSSWRARREGEEGPSFSNHLESAGPSPGESPPPSSAEIDEMFWEEMEPEEIPRPARSRPWPKTQPSDDPGPRRLFGPDGGEIPGDAVAAGSEQGDLRRRGPFKLRKDGTPDRTTRPG